MMKALEFEIEGRTVRGYAQEIGGVFWVHVDGETFSWRPAPEGGRRANAGASSVPDAGIVLSPMPGRIAKVHVTTGEAVAVGGALITLEAMKMEYALKARAPGFVRQILCKAGDQVTLGQVLAVLEEKG